jgi:hypothetical protein
VVVHPAAVVCDEWVYSHEEFLVAVLAVLVVLAQRQGGDAEVFCVMAVFVVPWALHAGDGGKLLAWRRMRGHAGARSLGVQTSGGSISGSADGVRWEWRRRPSLGVEQPPWRALGKGFGVVVTVVVHIAFAFVVAFGCELYGGGGGRP